MVKSMFAGVSGLKAHQQKMDVIGNNIANVNTWGYKSYNYNFMDSIYSTATKGAAGGVTAGAAGGRNPSQVGYGAAMGSIGFSFVSGAPSPTGNDLDCMIDGTGFFLVGGMINGGITDIGSSGLNLSRVGIFSVDSNGYLVDDQRNYVYGYALEPGTGIPEKPATKATYTLEGVEMTVVPDQQAGTTEITVGGKTMTVTGTLSPKDTDTSTLLKRWFDEMEAQGQLSGYSYSLDKESTDTQTGTITMNLTITRDQAGVEGGANQAITGLTAANQSYVDGTDLVPGVDPVFSDQLSTIQIPIDPDTGRQYEIQSYTISEDGVISGVDKQNRPISIGQLALVSVQNPNGLEKTDGYYFKVGDNAGEVTADKPNGGPVGTIRSKYLEMANVDLANEFSNMITTQRGFQANSKIITVTDEMLQELVNMKR